MPRGRHQYYDPILQVPSLSEGAPNNLERIELFPIGQESTSRLPEQIGKWVARHVGADGRVLAESSGSFQHDAALAEAQQMWPGLEVYELTSEIEDSTWEGVGPSPRLWQNSAPETGISTPPASSDGPSFVVADTKAGAEQPATIEDPDAVHIRAIQAEPGVYLHIDDVKRLLLSYADQFEEDKNPSGALALREAAEMLSGGGNG